MKKINVVLTITLLVILAVSVTVSAFGVGFRGSKIALPPGAVLNTEFSLQNNEAGTGTLTMSAEIEEGSKYIALTGGDRFEVPEGENTVVPIKITIPENAKAGDVYNVKVLFKQQNTADSAGAGGTTVGFVFNQRSSFDIEVVEKPFASEEKTRAASGLNFMWWIAGIIVLIIIIIWIIVKMKKRD